MSSRKGSKTAHSGCATQASDEREIRDRSLRRCFAYRIGLPGPSNGRRVSCKSRCRGAASGTPLARGGQRPEGCIPPRRSGRSKWRDRRDLSAACGGSTPRGYGARVGKDAGLRRSRAVAERRSSEGPGNVGRGLWLAFVEAMWRKVGRAEDPAGRTSPKRCGCPSEVREPACRVVARWGSCSS